jgi:hypothetical protein
MSSYKKVSLTILEAALLAWVLDGPNYGSFLFDHLASDRSPSSSHHNQLQTLYVLALPPLQVCDTSFGSADLFEPNNLLCLTDVLEQLPGF